MRDKGSASFAVVNAYKAYTGSSSVARSYYDVLSKQHCPVHWYQCVSSKDSNSYEQLGTPIEGWKSFRDDYNLVLNSLLVFPRKIGHLKERVTILTDPILLGAATHLTDSVLIVHDIREFSDHRRGVAAGVVYRWLFRALNHVANIVCDSETTKAELLRFYQPEVPVDVVYPCSRLVAEPERHIERSLKRMSDQRTINLLYISADRPYKNVGLFCDLAKRLEAPRGGWTFRFRLISQLGPDLTRKVSQLGASNLEVIPSLSDLSPAYEWSDILVHPSMLEGFGLPPVEAMQFGIPIVASIAPGLREIVDTGGILVNPDDMEQWIAAVTGLTEPSFYTKRAHASADRGKQFTAEAFSRRLNSWMQSRLLTE
jgi:glycosyltransferase involved in cell wall biosynthesis